MSEIVLKRANVEKRVNSEDKAKVLEAKGFVRTDGKKTAPAPSADVEILKKELEDTREQLKGISKKAETSEKELADTKELLQESEKKVQDLEMELSGTKEQLEAAIKKNKAASGK